MESSGGEVSCKLAGLNLRPAIGKEMIAKLAPSSPKDVPDLVGGTLFLPLENSQLEAGDSKLPSHTGRAPRQHPPPQVNTVR